MDEAGLADPQRVGKIIDRETEAEVPVLHRDKATFSTSVQGTATEVTLRVPYEGQSGHFYLEVPGAGPVSIDATPVGDRTFDQPEGSERALLFRRTFPAGTSSAEIKRWGKDLADQTEAYLNALRPDVEQRALALRTRAHTYAETRLSTLQAQRSLAEGLGEGI
ncbi:hypothetical protein BKA19_0808 [Blastococcus saxobsidens]|uniref:Uncharacterized protein n=2 Tax=Blastococcus saxobsidens TaxID=138336 RepID=A0A4Q7Y2W2_9ACTN|nr:hypothetical protein BKA19_0808 [Blastococcus saxobsidens]